MMSIQENQNNKEDQKMTNEEIAKVIPSDINTVEGILGYLFLKIKQWTTEAEDAIAEMIETNTRIDGQVIERGDVYPYARTVAEKELYEFQEKFNIPMSLNWGKENIKIKRSLSLIEMAFELTVSQMELIGGTGDIPMDVFETIEIAITSAPSDRQHLFQSPEWWEN